MEIVSLGYLFGVQKFSGGGGAAGKKLQGKMGYVMEGKNGVKTALAREATTVFARAEMGIMSFDCRM